MEGSENEYLSDGLRNIALNNHDLNNFCSNKISTTKYNLFSFLPKFLFEQFRRYANIFFLCISLLQQIPNVSPTGRFVTIVPFTVILLLTALKELYEDFLRHKADRKVNNSKVLVIRDNNQGWIHIKWKDIRVGDIVRVEHEDFFPADLIVLSSSEPQAMCYIETANLDGETNLKIRTGLEVTSQLESNQEFTQLQGTLQCELPNKNLYEFKGSLKLNNELKSTPIGPSSVLLRGAKLMNTKWIIGIVVYSGHDSKLLMNSTKAPLKRSTVDKVTNHQIVFMFLILLIMSLLSAGANEILKDKFSKHMIYLGDLSSNSFIYNLFTFIILYNNLIPISLQVTLEFVKFIQAFFIKWDKDMYYEPTNTHASARTSNLNEELGQIKYIFSDKTGTLTQNVMEFKQFSIAGVHYITKDNPKEENNSEVMNNLRNQHPTWEIIEEFLVIMAICHTVIPEEKKDQLYYNASSPDEKALVEGAARYGYRFVARKPNCVIIETPFLKEQTYEILNVIEFTSDRKRMSVVVRKPNGEIKLFCKGADTMIFERLDNSESGNPYLIQTTRHLEFFAEQGLRTLCLASKSIDDETYSQWADQFHLATVNIENKDEEIARVAELLEKEMFLLGATAIEDKLQDGVPETIKKLLEANIHLWVLTGDKKETAINIGHSCQLLDKSMVKIILDSDSLDDTRSLISQHLENYHSKNLTHHKSAVIIEGKTLSYALNDSLKKDFLELCCICQSVICCRVSPIQKAEVVELVKDNINAISLAIGDGANDVAMIQKAHIGVGISGNEGLQAANSSDFAIGQFRYLSKLLLVHGAWNYERISKVILYSFYKNICLYVIELWFAIFNFWSGQVLFERWTIGLYNIIFTSLPPIAIGLFDQNCKAETRLKNPQLYHSSQNSESFNLKIFWMWIGTSILHSIVLFGMPMLGYLTECVWLSGLVGGYLVVGNIVYSYVVVTVCIKAGLEIFSWNYLTHIFIWGSILSWILFLIIYSYVWPIGLPIAANMAGMHLLVYSSSLFWFGFLLVPFAALIPDITYIIIKRTIFPTETDQIRNFESKFKPKDVSSSYGSIRPVSQDFVLLERRTLPPLPKQASIITEDLELSSAGRGYAFSQEEHGVISQAEFVRRYDTTTNSALFRRNNEKQFLDKIIKNLPGSVE